MFKQLIAVLVVALCVGAGTMTAQSQSQTAADTFIWHGELVSVDQATGTFTVKARMLSDAAKDVARFKAGDTVVLTWSGVDKYADAIRHIAKQDVNQKITDPFAVAVELASPDVQNDYVTFKFRAGNAVESVKSVKPGEWVTVTTKKGSANNTQAVVSVEPYNKPASNT